MNNFFINFGIAEEKCNRKYMEDFNKIYIDNEIKYFSISDGHGDDLISKYVNENFIKSFKERCNFLTMFNHNDFFAEIATNLDNEIRFKHNIGYKSGSTHIAVIIYKNFVYIVNIGDSIATLNVNNIIVYKNLRHTPNIYIEKKRITKTVNIINNRINGILNVSRGFGDYYLKPQLLSNDNPVSCIPDVKRYSLNVLTENKTFILLASDGILLHLSLEIINSYIYKMLMRGIDPHIIAQQIVKFYKDKKNNDNVTVIIITLNTFISDLV